MCADLNESKDKQQKKELRMKVSQFVHTIFSSKKTTKLKTDAVMVPDDLNTGQITPSSVSSSPSRFESFESWPVTNGSVSPINGTRIEPGNGNQQVANYVSNATSNHAMLSHSPNNLNNNLTINQFESQNNYTFSHVNGLHIGPVSIFNATGSPVERKASTNESVDLETNMAEPTTDSKNRNYRKTTSIASKYFCFLSVKNTIDCFFSVGVVSFPANIVYFTFYQHIDFINK